MAFGCAYVNVYFVNVYIEYKYSVNVRIECICEGL